MGAVETTAPNTSDVNWDDLNPKCRRPECSKAAEHIVQWQLCGCLDAYKKKTFICEPCLMTVRVCPICYIRGYETDLGRL